VSDREVLLYWIGCDTGAEKVVVVFAIEQRGEIDSPLFEQYREGETCVGRTSASAGGDA
jgi:hypothetical protein